MEKKEMMDLMLKAIGQINDAMKKIDAVSDGLGIIKPGDTIPIEKLAYMAGKKAGVSPFCAEDVLRSAFSIIHDFDLSISMEEKEDE